MRNSTPCIREFNAVMIRVNARLQGTDATVDGSRRRVFRRRQVTGVKAEDGEEAELAFARV